MLPLLVFHVTVSAALPAAFNLPTVDSHAALSVRTAAGATVALESTRPSAGVLLVDGVSTGLAWPGHPMQALRLADGRVVLHSTYDRRVLFLWNPRLARLTELGAQELYAVGGRQVFVKRRPGLSISDVAPGEDRLRPLWETNEESRVQSLSSSGDGLRGLIRSARGCAMLTLVPGHEPRLQRSPALQVLLDAGFDSPLDGFRGDRLLLARPHLARYPEPVMADAAIFDFSTAQARMLGVFPGGYGASSGMHPTIELLWRARKDEHGLEQVLMVLHQGPVATVIESTEELVVHTR